MSKFVLAVGGLLALSIVATTSVAAADGSTSLSPSQIDLDDIGSSATVEVVADAIGQPANGVQINVQHTDFIAISDVECLGRFAGGVVVPPTDVDGGTLFGCVALNADSSHIVGVVASFIVTRLTTGNHSITLAAGPGVQFPTQFSEAGTAISPGEVSGLFVGGYGLPGPPTNVQVTAGNGSLSISWAPPSDNGGRAISSYSVMAQPSGVSASVSEVLTETVLSGLPNGITQTITVAAINEVGEGPQSAEKNATPVAPAATPTPSPTPSPTPTRTPVPPTSTPTPISVSTPAPATTRTPTPSPQPTSATNATVSPPPTPIPVATATPTPLPVTPAITVVATSVVSTLTPTTAPARTPGPEPTMPPAPDSTPTPSPRPAATARPTAVPTQSPVVEETVLAGIPGNATATPTDTRPKPTAISQASPTPTPAASTSNGSCGSDGSGVSLASIGLLTMPGLIVGGRAMTGRSFRRHNLRYVR